MAEPEEVEDEERQGSNKEAICVEDDPNEMDDDCPKIYNMGGNAEMVLNKGVGNCVIITSNEDDLLVCHTIFRWERIV